MHLVGKPTGFFSDNDLNSPGIHVFVLVRRWWLLGCWLSIIIEKFIGFLAAAGTVAARCQRWNFPLEHAAHSKDLFAGLSRDSAKGYRLVTTYPKDNTKKGERTTIWIRTGVRPVSNWGREKVSTPFPKIKKQVEAKGIEPEKREREDREGGGRSGRGTAERNLWKETKREREKKHPSRWSSDPERKKPSTPPTQLLPADCTKSFFYFRVLLFSFFLCYFFVTFLPRVMRRTADLRATSVPVAHASISSSFFVWGAISPRVCFLKKEQQTRKKQNEIL